MISAVIIDDEQHCIDRLNRLITGYCKQSVELLGGFQTIEEGVNAIKTLQPDLVFLDVEIYDQTGFDLLKQFSEINFEVIFTTAFEKYAIQAFRFSAVDYLLKPIDRDNLIQALERVEKKISNGEMSKKLEVLLHNIKDIGGQSKKISVPTINGLMFIPVNDIIRCHSNINYTTIILKDKKKYTVAKTLKEFESLLTEYNFFRVHNSHLINLFYIKSYQKGKGGSVLMTDHSEIEVSIRRKEQLLKRLSEM